MANLQTKLNDVSEPPPRSGHPMDLGGNDRDHDWMCDAYECVTGCCGAEIIGYVMDRFAASVTGKSNTLS